MSVQPLDEIFHIEQSFDILHNASGRNFLYSDMKCEIICLSHAAQLLVLNGRIPADQHSMNQATFHSTFPILVFTKIFDFVQIYFLSLIRVMDV